MNPESKHVEEKLLDYAYGELGADDSKTVEAHLQSCPRCAEALTAMKRVRQTMSRLPVAPAPAKGLDSLIAYAEQTAQRARLGQKRRSPWVRWLVPITGVAALSVVLVISGKAVQTGDLPAARSDSLPEIRSESPPAAPGRTANDVIDPQMQRTAERKPQIGNEGPESSEGPAKASQRRHGKEKAQMVNGPSRPEIAKKLAQVPPADYRDSTIGERVSRSRPLGAVAGATNQAAPAPSAAKPREAREFDGDGAEAGVEGGVPGGVVGGVVGGVLGGHSLPPPPADDRQQEVVRLRQALADGAVGQERARILLQLCNVLDALKRESEADSACDALIREFPNSDEARTALDRQRARATRAVPTRR